MDFTFQQLEMMNKIKRTPFGQILIYSLLETPLAQINPHISYHFLETYIHLIRQGSYKHIKIKIFQQMSNRETHRYIKWRQYVLYEFTKQDQALLKLINQNGSKQWKIISKLMKTQEGIHNRSGKQCRQRWLNHLNDQNKKFVWSVDEDRKLFQLYQEMGTKQCQIVKKFPSNSDSFIKNRFYSLTRKSMRKMCKYCNIKTKELNVYNVKPSTVALILYENAIKESQETIPEQLHYIDKEQIKIYYRKIGQLIKLFALKTNPTRSELQIIPKRVAWALQQIIKIDSSFQRQKLIKEPESTETLNEQMNSFLLVPQLQFNRFSTDYQSLFEIQSNQEYLNNQDSIIRSLFGDEQKRVSIKFRKA